MRLLATGAVLAALAGCGDDTPDTQKVKDNVADTVSGDAVKATTVDCPPKNGQGDAFECGVKLSNGGKGKVEVTREGGDYSYNVVDGSVQVPGKWVDEQLEEALSKKGTKGATVNCPDPVVVRVNSGVQCDVAGAEDTATPYVEFVFSTPGGDIDAASIKRG